MKRKILIFLVVILGVMVIVLVYLQPLLSVATGYSAHRMCSCYYVEKRAVEDVLANDLGHGPQSLTKNRIDEEKREVVSTIFGMAKQRAVFRENLGCILIHGSDDYGVTLSLPPFEPMDEDPLLKNTDSLQFDRELLDQVLKKAIQPGTSTRAVIVVYDDVLVGEKYADGFDAHTPLLGWSMTKSITNALVGILVRAGQLTLDQDHLIPAWTDDRADIRLRDLMQMQSGLKFNENYATLSDATEMLYRSEDMAERAAQMPLEHEIGKVWYYSSGTTNILSGILKDRFRDEESYLQFPHLSLFRKLGMNSAILEPDESGTYIGSSYGYATPRDWAKFGLLYLNYGHWQGEQLLDSSWVEFTRTPAEHSNGVYGGQFWLNAGFSNFPDAPDDLYFCSGFEGQYVFIIPSYNLIIVRQGLDLSNEFDVNQFLANVLSAFDTSE
jgi:CubicO group peptidase (beta-lactamase class C family)